MQIDAEGRRPLFMTAAPRETSGDESLSEWGRGRTAAALLARYHSSRIITTPFTQRKQLILGWHIAALISNGCWCKELKGGDQGQIELRSAARRIPPFASCSCTTGAAALW
jgi:hypothetical protein